MGFLSALRPRRSFVRSGSAFPAADMSRLTSSWTGDPGSINRWLRYELGKLRARSRQLARGDAYGAKFITSCVNNIGGPHPFALQAKAKTTRGLIAKAENARIEAAWAERARPGNCDVTGKLSLSALYRLLIRCLARDGEFLVRRIRGTYGGLKLQILDIDRLDETYNENRPGGGAVKMGVELDRNSRPTAYYILKQHPGESIEWTDAGRRDHERVPADQIHHCFIADWPEQVRGFPWMHAAMIRLHHLGGFEEAAVINARIGASKVAVIEGPESKQALALNATGKDSAGNLLTDIEPGQYWRLPDGAKLSSFDPSFPDASVGPFIQACMRGVGAAVNMAYHSIANDPGAVNYSTARVALLDERDGWSTMQQWFVEHFCQPDAADWMSMCVTDGTLPAAYWAYRNSLFFQPRTWQWIDPEKEVNAEVTAIENKLKSRTQSIRERGGDIEDTFDEIKAELELAASMGIDLAPQPKQGEPNGGTPKPEVDA